MYNQSQSHEGRKSTFYHTPFKHGVSNIQYAHIWYTLSSKNCNTSDSYSNLLLSCFKPLYKFK